jgi:pentose-5-phosphate-3-epimerase
MIEHPDEFIPAFAQAGVDWISVHQEACTHLDRTLHLIASHGCKPGSALSVAACVLYNYTIILKSILIRELRSSGSIEWIYDD